MNATLLSDLLTATKLGLERKRLLRWLAVKDDRFLAPAPLLLASPNAGLTNQIYSLVGCIVLANLTSSTLVLPDLASGNSHSELTVETLRPIPFADLFDASHFIHALRGVASVVNKTTAGIASHNTHRLGSDRGWFIYKAMFSSSIRPHLPLMRYIERSVLLALRASHSMRLRAASLRSKLGLHMHYGCVHTRIERDMLKAIRFNRAGSPPTLDDYFAASWPRRYPDSIGRTQKVFIPISLNLREVDSRRLRKPIATWSNATILRTLHLTRGGGGGGKRAGNYSDTLASWLDLLLCRNAKWLMGWSGSTYARLLGLYQKADSGRSWYVACPNGVSCRVDAGLSLIPHELCLEIENVTSTTRVRRDWRASCCRPGAAGGSVCRHYH
jgi:hypothetical protein